MLNYSFKIASSRCGASFGVVIPDRGLILLFFKLCFGLHQLLRKNMLIFNFLPQLVANFVSLQFSAGQVACSLFLRGSLVKKAACCCWKQGCQTYCKTKITFTAVWAFRFSINIAGLSFTLWPKWFIGVNFPTNTCAVCPPWQRFAELVHTQHASSDSICICSGLFVCHLPLTPIMLDHRLSP